MTHRPLPLVGHWYSHLDKGGLFQVVALDEPAGTIEFQDFAGTIDEMDLDEWLQLGAEEVEPPEDWSGPLDDLEPDDFGYTDAGTGGERPRPRQH